MDVIASSAFSTKIDSHNDPENKFVLTARDVFRISFNWRLILMFLFPKLLKKKTGQTRNDFLQLLMDTAKEVSEDRKSESSEKERDDTAAVYGDVDINHHIFKTVTQKSNSIQALEEFEI
ncbi:cytochrome P450 3A24 [Trichonephila inaurata madagascariensis]|uniref:Cytochrome P450 3A24 n=1 Tax=Trichonephila inaurata madagascariensis TaxID=2747483 RepID=A0A8X6JUU3_9ARAC|nr:cytochrome P450 3A24 [Trichonephila inaurata madagascariensis]